MRVLILLFGPQAALAGSDRICVDIDDATVTCRRLRDHIARDVPDLKPTLPAARFAVNHALADDDDVIGANDEVAMIALVSGG